MTEFEGSPVAPAEILEQTLPALFRTQGLADALRGVELVLGVALAGEGGGEWRLELAGGVLSVDPGSRDGAVVSWVQSVEDWRRALQSGGGADASLPPALLRKGVAAVASGRRAAPDADWFRRLAQLDGLLRVVLTGGETGDWSVAFSFGPGPIPERATATVSVAGEDAAALARGALQPLEAFLAGRVTIAGDMLLVMQLQALAAPIAAPGSSGSGAASS